MSESKLVSPSRSAKNQEGSQTSTNTFNLGIPLSNGINSLYKDELLNAIATIIHNKILVAETRTNPYENDVNSILLYREAKAKANQAVAEFYKRGGN